MLYVCTIRPDHNKGNSFTVTKSKLLTELMSTRHKPWPEEQRQKSNQNGVKVNMNSKFTLFNFLIHVSCVILIDSKVLIKYTANIWIYEYIIYIYFPLVFVIFHYKYLNIQIKICLLIHLLFSTQIQLMLKTRKSTERKIHLIQRKVKIIKSFLSK